MRSVVIAALLLGGCATTAEPPIAVHGCNAAAVANYAGQVATAEIAAELVAKSRAMVLRWGPPGVMLTMDYRSDRLTVRLSADNHILALNCG
jgi:hypothetical protein